MKKALLIFSLWLVSYTHAYAATYTLPADITGNPFGCTGSGPVYTCSGTMDLPEDTIIILTADVTLNITGDFRAGEDFTVQANGFTLNINVTNDVRISSRANFTGDISAGDDIRIGEDSIVVGNLTAADNLNLDQGTVVNGICSPTHSQCTGVSPAPAAGCETLGDDFNSTSYSNQDGTINWSSNWVETNDNNSPVDGYILITGSRLLIANSNRSITRNGDLSAYASATLTFAYQESGFDNGNDYIDVEIQGGGNGWTSLQNFAGSNVGSGNANLTVPSSFLANDFQIRFITSNNLGWYDRFYIDNLRIEACGAASLAANMDFHFDELSWTGTPNEVLDSSANANHASISPGSGVNTVALGQVCRAGQFDGINDYLVSNDIYATLRTTASMSFWIKTTQTGNNTNWQAPGVAGVEQSGGGDDIFWGWLDATGHIGISKWDTPSAKSSVAINDGVYHHVVLTRDSPSGAYKIYIDGALNASGTTGSGDVGTNFTSIGRIEDTAGSPEYLQAELDELLIFDTVLSDTQVSSIYTNQRDGNNYDGSPRVCLDSPLVEWHFDESSWNGSAGEVVDSQGTLNATAVNGANTGGSNPAIAGDPGTCRYGAFDGADDYVDLTGMTNLSDSFTITAWIYANETGNDQRIYVDDQNNSNGFGLSLGDGGNGQLRFFSRSVSPISVDTQSAVISTGRWYHVAAVHDVSAKTRQIYVNGTAVTLTGGVTAPTYTGTWGVDSGAASIGGENNNSGEGSANYRFNGNIDEVRVYDGVLSAAQISAVMNLTRTCAITGPDHYVISHSTSGVTCEAESVTVTAHDAGDQTINPSSSTTITLTTSIANDGWALRSGSGTFTAPNQYTFSGGESSAQFWLTKTTATTAPHMDIDVSDGSVSDNDNGTEAQAPIAFSNTGFRFYADAVYNDIGTQIAGKASDTSPGQQALTLKAVETNTDTGACETVLTGVTPVEIAFECSTPASCVRPLYLGATSPSTLITGTSSGAGLNYQNVSLDFGVTGEASFVLNYPDTGAIRLYAQHTLPATLPSTGVTLNGSSNQFVSRPFGFDIQAVANPAAADHTGSVYRAAGEAFTVNVSAALWNASDDSNTDGVPDNHDDNDPSNNADLSGNTVTLGGVSYLGAPNFGQEGEQVQLDAMFIDPITSSYPDANFPPQTLNGFTAGADSTNTAVFNNVGVIEMRAAISDGDYLGTGAVETQATVSKSGYVGRFNPHHYSVTAAIVNNGCDTFTYAGQPFDANVTLEARSLGDALTNGYRGGYATLDIATELNVQNSATSAAYDNEAYTVNEGFSSGTIGQAQFDIDLRWDMPQQSVTNSIVQLIDSSDEVTLVASSPVSLGNTDVRYGRLWMSNVYGSELMDLTMPMRTQYFNGSNYILNSDDSCTTIDHNILNELGVTQSLANGGSSLVTVNSITAVAGILDINLTAPGVGHTGFVEVIPNLTISGETWLRYDWDSTPGAPGLENPSARANFGIYQGDSRQIYYRQIYR